MRYAWLLSLSLVACTPDIVPGAYFCGPERSCPADYVCDGFDDVCVLPSATNPFACESTENEPNDEPASAHELRFNGCISQLIEVSGCLTGGDAEDWFSFQVPEACAAVGVGLRLSSPIAYEVVGIELYGAGGELVTTGGSCANDNPNDNTERRCVGHELSPGESYLVRVFRTGEGNCGGDCAYNRYLLHAQLDRP